MHTEATEAPAQPAAVWEDFVDIFVSPREVFERRRNGNFVAAMITLTIALAILTIPAQMSMAGAVDAAFQEGLQNSAMSEISQEQLQQFGRLSVFTAAIGMLFATPVGIILTGLVLGISASLVAMRIPMGSAVMIATYAAFPKLLAIVATMMQALLVDPTRVNQVSVGPARFLGEGADPLLTSVLLRLDLFAIWGLILLAIGVATIGRTSGGRGWAAAGITWVVTAIPTVIIGIIAANRG